jgi:DNA-binding transcriptional LysR family regulator
MTDVDLSGVAWEDLSVLLAAFEHGSLNRAATALRIGQSTASRRLARLESALSTRLFDRTPDGLLPTEFAEQLRPHAELIAGHMADIARLASGQEQAPAGRVRLAVPTGLADAWLMPALPAFFAEFPDVEVDFVIGQAVVDLVRREADLALRMVRPTQPDLLFQRLWTLTVEPFVHPSLRGEGPRELRWVHLHDPDEHFFETRWVRERIAPRRTMRVTDWNAMFAAARAGIGPALLSPAVARPAGLVPVPGFGAAGERPVYLVCHRALRTVPRVAALRGWLVRDAQRVLAEALEA